MAENEKLLLYIKRAFELKNQECYKQAVEMLYKAISLEPDNAEILYQLGEMYYLMKNYARAIQYPEQILRNEENHIPARDLMRKIFIKQGELYSAKEVAEKIYVLEKTPENLSELLDIYGRLGLFTEFDKYQDEIIKSEKCSYVCAKSYFKAGDYEKAELYVNYALEINSGNDEYRILKGKIFFEKNESLKAREIFSSFDKNTQNPVVLNYLGLFALEDFNFVEAIKDFSKAVNIDKTVSKYSYNLGNAYFLNGWYKEAADAYQNAICIEPDNYDYRYSLAYLYYEYSNFSKAKQEVDYILENNGKHAGAKVLRALLLFKDKNYIEAEKILLSNLNAGLTDEFTISSLAKIEIELGKLTSAQQYMSDLINRFPDNLKYKCDLAEIYIKEKAYDKALELSQEVLKLNLNYIDGYIIGAKASILAGDYDSAKEFAQNVLSIDINCAAGYYYLAVVRKFENDYDEAIECMKRAITYDVSNPEYYAEMAEIYKLSGDNKTAFDYIKEAESIDDSEKYKILYKEFATLNRK